MISLFQKAKDYLQKDETHRSSIRMKNLIELKAEAYDILALIEAHQVKIQELQKSLMEKNKEIEEGIKAIKPEKNVKA